MAARLNPLLPKIISDNQSGFTKGRSITKNILLAQENIHSIDKKKLGDFRGFSMPPQGPITHLAYAYDVMIFSSESKKSLELILHQLKNYEKCCGQLINKEKIYFLVAPKTSSLNIQRIKSITGRKYATFNDMVNKIVRKITGWQGKLLSIGGRNILIKHVLQSQPIHLLVAIEPSKTVFEDIETYMARFFWGTTEGKKRYHWSSW
ncbi:uncharacterized protein LOC132038137 [Lycium ferocissimum]|uniref:uncharacterized protein LOC132038137 n=1 Tax=Lycium ferocissimum TaxID=112874 RepID=UPI0028152229|nr:uncharacterized protein LOC132038137 [Lycium ferocissimum]